MKTKIIILILLVFFSIKCSCNNMNNIIIDSIITDNVDNPAITNLLSNAYCPVPNSCKSTFKSSNDTIIYIEPLYLK